jgi:ankyrin repeat protein
MQYSQDNKILFRQLYAYSFDKEKSGIDFNHLAVKIKSLVSEYKTGNIIIDNGDAILNILIKISDLVLIKYLIENGADVNYKDIEGKTALHHAASLDLPDIIELLVKAGADIESEDNWGNSPLLRSIEGLTETTSDSFDKLLDLGADFDHKNKSGNSLLKLKDDVLSKTGKMEDHYKRYEKSRGVKLL